MPRKKKPPFLMLDERIMEDEEVQLLVSEKGYGALMIWLLILIKFKQYDKTDFMVPLERLDIFCGGFFEAPKEDVKAILGYVTALGWIKVWKDPDGKEFFYNERRRNDLLNQAVKYEAQKQRMDKVNEERYGAEEV